MKTRTMPLPLKVCASCHDILRVWREPASELTVGLPGHGRVSVAVCRTCAGSDKDTSDLDKAVDIMRGLVRMDPDIPKPETRQHLWLTLVKYCADDNQSEGGVGYVIWTMGKDRRGAGLRRPKVWP